MHFMANASHHVLGQEDQDSINFIDSKAARATSVAPELPEVSLFVTKLPLAMLERMVMGATKETKEDKANSGTKDIWLEEDGTSLPVGPNPIVRVSIVQNLKIEL